MGNKEWIQNVSGEISCKREDNIKIDLEGSRLLELVVNGTGSLVLRVLNLWILLLEC
jgi:hypothetical protein